MNARRKWLAAGAALPALAWTGALRAQAKLLGGRPQRVRWLSRWLEARNATRYTAS